MPFYKYFTKEAFNRRAILKCLYSEDVDRYLEFLALLSDAEKTYMEKKQTREKIEDLDALFKDLIDGAFYTQPSFYNYTETIQILFKKLYSNKKTFQSDVEKLNYMENYDLDPLLEALPFIMKRSD